MNQSSTPWTAAPEKKKSICIRVILVQVHFCQKCQYHKVYLPIQKVRHLITGFIILLSINLSEGQTLPFMGKENVFLMPQLSCN